MNYRVFMKSDEDSLGLSSPVGSFASEKEARSWVAKNIAPIFRKDCYRALVQTVPGAFVLQLLEAGFES